MGSYLFLDDSLLREMVVSTWRQWDGRKERKGGPYHSIGKENNQSIEVRQFEMEMEMRGNRKTCVRSMWEWRHTRSFHSLHFYAILDSIFHFLFHHGAMDCILVSYLRPQCTLYFWSWVLAYSLFLEHLQIQETTAC